VQQQGVRVEVISFRGNTSSDLIDVADLFIDIGSVAKVEKGARSGRRVAAEGDLSMTEVPDKESGVTPRRRRRDGEERPERAIRTGRRRGSPAAATQETEVPAAESSRPVALMPLPGEKLSRGAAIPASVAPAEPEDEPEDETQQSGDEPQEEGRRRRRRRGGRGRGRGGRGTEVGEVAEAPVDELEADLPDFSDEVAPLPQHAGFGSVWDSQIGVAPERRPAAAAPLRTVPLDDEDLDTELEPEVPEYLLTERRQQDRRRGGRGARGGGYRSALDRERFGTGTRPGFQRGPGRPSKGVRSSGPARPSAHSMEPIEQTPGGDPWSEVPPEVQELLRAEMARRGGAAPSAGPRTAAPQRSRGAGSSRVTAETPEAVEASTAEASPSAGSDDAAPPAAKSAPKRTPRRKAPATAETQAAVEASTAEASPSAGSDDAAPPAAKSVPKRAPRRKAPAAAETQAAVEASTAEAVKAAPKRAPRRKAPAAAEAAEAAEAGEA
jgi:ribonuclease E